MPTNQMENRHIRKELAKDAGLGSVSWLSVLAGTLAAYGLTAVLLAIAGGLAAAVNSGTNFNNVSWTDLKAGTGIIVGVVLFVSYLFGGYVAGRMARRSGSINGVLVFVIGVVLALAVGVWVKAAGGTSNITTTLRNVGAPTTWHEWSDVGTVAAVAALLGMLIGASVGGAMGEHWHTKFVARALDPNVGPEAEHRLAAHREGELADEAAREREARATTATTPTPEATRAGEGSAPATTEQPQPVTTGHRAETEPTAPTERPTEPTRQPQPAVPAGERSTPTSSR
jgi:hypothetical protein